jgi:hypothetical protein
VAAPVVPQARASGPSLAQGRPPGFSSPHWPRTTPRRPTPSRRGHPSVGSSSGASTAPGTRSARGGCRVHGSGRTSHPGRRGVPSHPPAHAWLRHRRRRPQRPWARSNTRAAGAWRAARGPSTRGASGPRAGWLSWRARPAGQLAIRREALRPEGRQGPPRRRLSRQGALRDQPPRARPHPHRPDRSRPPPLAGPLTARAAAPPPAPASPPPGAAPAPRAGAQAMGAWPQEEGPVVGPPLAAVAPGAPSPPPADRWGAGARRRPTPSLPPAVTPTAVPGDGGDPTPVPSAPAHSASSAIALNPRDLPPLVRGFYWEPLVVSVGPMRRRGRIVTPTPAKARLFANSRSLQGNCWAGRNWAAPRRSRHA